MPDLPLEKTNSLFERAHPGLSEAIIARFADEGPSLLAKEFKVSVGCVTARAFRLGIKNKHTHRKENYKKRFEKVRANRHEETEAKLKKECLRLGVQYLGYERNRDYTVVVAFVCKNPNPESHPVLCKYADLKRNKTGLCGTCNSQMQILNRASKRHPASWSRERVAQLVTENGGLLLDFSPYEGDASRSQISFKCRCDRRSDKLLGNYYRKPYCATCGRQEGDRKSHETRSSTNTSTPEDRWFKMLSDTTPTGDQSCPKNS